jgi:hypothetical protein
MGDMVFDRRGFVRLKGDHANQYSASQGDYRQTMSAAQKCIRVCGPTTRQLLKDVADDPAYWTAYLVKNIIGPKRTLYLDSMTRFGDPEVDQPGWETAAVEAGLRPVNLDYANEGEITPGAQLFMLASTLYTLGLYETIGPPNGNAAGWKSQIIS